MIPKLFNTVMIILLFSFILTINSHAEEVNISIASVPFHSQMKNDSTGQGLIYDLVYEISKAGGLEPRFHFFPLKRTIHMFVNNKTEFLVGFPDFLIPFGLKSNQIEFVPIMINNLYLFYYNSHHTEEIKFEKYSDLKHYLIGVIRGSPLVFEFKKAGVKSYEFNTYTSGFQMLRQKRLDIISSPRLAGEKIIQKYFPTETGNFKILAKPVESIKFGILIKKNNINNRLKNLFKMGLDKIKKNGKYVKIFKKYMGEKIPPNTML